MRKVHTKIAPNAEKSISEFHMQIIDDLEKCIAENDVVVVGMAVNPFVKKARKLLAAQNISFTYKEYGGYFSSWKERLAIKIWSGWPTFPQIFIRQSLIGGATDLEKLLENNQLDEILKHE